MKAITNNDTTATVNGNRHDNSSVDVGLDATMAPYLPAIDRSIVSVSVILGYNGHIHA